MSELDRLTDVELVNEASYAIWKSALDSAFGATPESAAANDARVSAAMDEATRRGKPWLYQRAWNSAYREAGHELSFSDRNRANPSNYENDVYAEVQP